MVGTLLVLGVTASISWGLFRYVRSTPRFALRHVVVEGSKRYSDAELQRIAGVAIGSNLFALDIDGARHALERNPWLQQARVERKLPSTLWMYVVEREATLLVVKGGDLLLAAPGGHVFKRYEAGDPSDLVIMTGLDEVADTELKSDHIEQLISIAQEIARNYERVFSTKRFPLQEVHWKPEGGFDITVGREAIRISLGQGPYRSKLERAAQVVAELERRRAQVSSVFVDNEAHPDRIVARLR